MRTVSEEKPAKPEEKARSDGPMVLPRAFALLRLLAENKRGMTLSEISAATSVPKSSLSSTLKALDEQKLLVREGWHYSLGPEAYALASVILARSTLSQIARSTLVETMEEAGETVLLATVDSNGVDSVYVDAVETRNPIRYSVPIGTRRPLFPTAAGRMLLAYFTPEQLRAYFDRIELRAYTENTVIDREDLERRIAEARASGISTNSGEFSADSTAFAAPVLDHSDALVAVVTIALPTSRAIRKREQLIEQVKRAAARLSRLVGHHEDPAGG